MSELYAIDSIYVSTEDRPKPEENQSTYEEYHKEEENGTVEKVKMQAKKVYKKVKKKPKEYVAKYITNKPDLEKKRRKRRKKRMQQNQKSNLEVGKLAKIKVLCKEKSGVILFVLLALVTFAGSTVGFLNCGAGKTRDGFSCEDINECYDAKKCSFYATCTNTGSSKFPN